MCGQSYVGQNLVSFTRIWPYVQEWPIQQDTRIEIPKLSRGMWITFVMPHWDSLYTSLRMESLWLVAYESMTSQIPSLLFLVSYFQILLFVKDLELLFLLDGLLEINSQAVQELPIFGFLMNGGNPNNRTQEFMLPNHFPLKVYRKWLTGSIMNRPQRNRRLADS